MKDQGNAAGPDASPALQAVPDAEALTLEVGDDRRPIAVLRRAGAAPGVLWLGGFRSDMQGGKARAVDAWAARQGLAATRFDYSGHGRSGGRFVDGTISAWLEDATAVYERATAGDQVLVGSSMGAWIALLLARARRAAGDRRIKGLVLVAPAPDFTERLMWANFPKKVRAAILERGYHELPSAYAEEPTVVTRRLIEDGRLHLLLDAPIEPGCPVHILQGVKDPDVPWRHAIDLVTALARDDVVLTLIKDGDHRLSRPEDIERLIAAIADMTGRS